MFPRTIESGVTPEDFELSYENVSFETSDGIEIKGWFIPKETGNEQAPVIIFLHGYPAEKGDLLQLARTFHDFYNILLFDFRALGESGGYISSLGFNERKDVLGAVEYVKMRGYTDIGVWGFSMGGAAGLFATAESNDIDVVVADSSYANLSNMGQVVFREFSFLQGVFGKIMMLWAGLFLQENPANVSPANALSNIYVPTLISYVTNDNVIPESESEMFKNVARDKENVSIVTHESDIHGLLHPEYQIQIRDFFDKYLAR